MKIPPVGELPEDLQEAIRGAGDFATREALRADIVAFALQYAESVREACARLCDEINDESGGGFEPFAAAIRRKEE